MLKNLYKQKKKGKKKQTGVNSACVKKGILQNLHKTSFEGSQKKPIKKKLWGSYFNTCRWVYSLSFSTSTRNGYSSFTVKNARFFVRVLTELLTYYHQREGHHLLQFLSPYPCLQPSLITVTEKSIIINKQTLLWTKDFVTYETFLLKSRLNEHF